MTVPKFQPTSPGPRQEIPEHDYLYQVEMRVGAGEHFWSFYTYDEALGKFLSLEQVHNGHPLHLALYRRIAGTQDKTRLRLLIVEGQS